MCSCLFKKFKKDKDLCSFDLENQGLTNEIGLIRRIIIIWKLKNQYIGRLSEIARRNVTLNEIE